MTAVEELRYALNKVIKDDGLVRGNCVTYDALVMSHAEELDRLRAALSETVPPEFDEAIIRSLLSVTYPDVREAAEKDLRALLKRAKNAAPQRSVAASANGGDDVCQQTVEAAPSSIGTLKQERIDELEYHEQKLFKIEEFLLWCVDNSGECLGDHPDRLQRAKDALK